jgi:sirohydrochlorin cobaltochelatase
MAKGVHDFSRSLLLLVGHGSGQNEEAAAPVYQQAAILRGRGLFGEVREAFWRQEPGIEPVVRQALAPVVFAVPILISEGYFTRRVIPQALGLPPVRPGEFPQIQSQAGRTLCYCGPVGTHPRLADLILARAKEALATKPGGVTLFVVGHGTVKDRHSRQAIEAQVLALRERREFAAVQALFLEEEPRVSDCFRLAQTRDVLVVPCFISDGQHSREDIPRLLGASSDAIQARIEAGETAWRNPTASQGKRIWYASSIGTDPRLAEVILDRVREAAERL